MDAKPCRNCGYPINPSTAVPLCPECGAEPDLLGYDYHRRRALHRWIAIFGILTVPSWIVVLLLALGSCIAHVFLGVPLGTAIDTRQHPVLDSLAQITMAALIVSLPFLVLAPFALFGGICALEQCWPSKSIPIQRHLVLLAILSVPLVIQVCLLADFPGFRSLKDWLPE